MRFISGKPSMLTLIANYIVFAIILVVYGAQV